MANKRISDLPKTQSASSPDLFPIVDVAGFTTKKITFGDLKDLILGNIESIVLRNESDVGQLLSDVSSQGSRLAALEFKVDEGGDGLPNGGDIGEVLAKQSGNDGDADWENFDYSGFSQRFNSQFDSDNLRDTLNKIIQITYVAPSVSLSASGNSLREKGDPVTATTLTANVTKKSDNIAKIEFFYNGVSFANHEPPSNIGSGNTPQAWSGSFSDNKTFKVEITDDGSTGGPTKVSASTTFNFVYPYYTGAGNPGLTPQQVAGLTKRIINSNANLSVSFNALKEQSLYFAYPSSYGDLTEIKDENNFELFGSFTKTVAPITGLDGNPVNYNIYELTVPLGTDFNTALIFKR